MSSETFGKGPPILATPNWSDYAEILSYTGFDSDEDAERLQTMQPSDRAQTTGVAGGMSITYDRGAAYPFNLASLLFGNMTGTASWRVRAAGSVAELDTGPRLDTSLGWGAALRFQGGTGTAICSYSAWITLTTFSISFRVRIDSRGIVERGILKFAPNAAGAYALVTLGADGRIHLKRSSGGLDIATAAIPNGEWHRVTVTYNASGGACQIILDGVVVATATLGGGFVTSPHVLTLSVPESQRFYGSIDDVRLWSSARTAAQEIADMGAEISTSGSLVGYWKLNEVQGIAGDNFVVGPDMDLSGAPIPHWSFPERYWASPNLDSWVKTHSLWWDTQALTYGIMRVEAIDPQNTGGFLYFGRFYASAAHQFSRGCNYGSSPLGWTDPSTRTRLASGVGPIVRRAKRAQIRKLRLYSTDKTEIYYDVDNATRLRG
ncbi:MAG: LamG domain-containing protein, partial [Patescibacteria group bacterium]